MHQPPGFYDRTRPSHVCLLRKSLYGLKQAPRAWYQRFATYLTSICFQGSQSDHSLFVFHSGPDTAYLLLYVDDIVLTASSTSLLSRLMALLRSEFAMTDLGSLSYFIGVSMSRTPTALFLHQQKYALEIVDKACMTSCKPATTPVDCKSKLDAASSPKVEDPTSYHSLAGALQYMSFTRPEIASAVQQICLYMHDPREHHLQALKWIIRYIKDTFDMGLHLGRSRFDSLTTYSDADWAGCPETRRSTSGFAVYLGDNMVSWSFKRQATISRSSAEAEYRGVANAVAETCWLRNLLYELRVPLR